MTKKIKLLILSFICLLAIALGMTFLLTPSVFTSDAKTLNTTVHLSGNGVSWQNATKDTFTQYEGLYTYTVYGANGTYNVKQGTDGANPDFDWGHAYINSSSTSDTHSVSGSAGSINKNAINCFIEGFRSSYYSVTADVYANGTYAKTINNFDSSSDADYDKNKEAQYRHSSTGNCNFEVYYTVTPKDATANFYYKYHNASGDTNTKISSITAKYGTTFSSPAISPKTGYHFQDWRNSSGTAIYSNVPNYANLVMYLSSPTFYAYCPANQYYVEYNKNANDATGSMSKSTFTYDSTGYLTSNSFTRSGYTFQGWSTNSNATTATYSNGTLIKNLTTVNEKTITLYAVWKANTYNVELRDENGSKTIGSVTATYNSPMPELSSSLFPPAKTGYEFQGYYWNVNGSGTKYYNANGTSASNWTQAGGSWLAAYYTGIPYGVHYYRNYNASDNTYISRSGFVYGTAKTLANATDSEFFGMRTAYTFSGWNTKRNGSGDNYPVGSSVSTLTTQKNQDVSLYAQWTPINYNITFNLNGANSSLPSGTGNPMTYNTTMTTGLPTPTRTGYGFNTWKATSVAGNWSSGSTYSAGTSLSGKYGNVTLQAQWTAKEWALTYDATGGEVSPASKKVYIDKEYGELPTPTKPGYVFLGWYTDKTGGKLVDSTTKMLTENATIYAHWQGTWAIETKVTQLNALNNSIEKGTQNNPYIISNSDELALLAQKVSNGESEIYDGKYFRQTDNIDLTKDKNGNTVNYAWYPIGTSKYAFSGHYDGQGFIISNLNTANVKNPSTLQYGEYQGLFGYATNAEIKNINVVSGTIYGDNHTGGIVGYMNGGSITNCRNGATITGNNYCGLIGKANCVKVTSCYNYGNITGKDFVGGIVGYAQSFSTDSKTVIKNCYSKCTISATNNAGGIVGYATSYTSVSASGFQGDVTSDSNKASIVGYSDSSNGVIENCFAIITGSNDLGWSNGDAKVKNCISKLSNGTNKKHTGSDFLQWSLIVNGEFIELEDGTMQPDGQPIPAGFSWIGTGGDKISEDIIKILGY